MKIRLQNRLAAFLVAILAINCVQQLTAQQLPPMQYRIHWVDIPVDFDDLRLRGMNDHRVVTGYWQNDIDGLLNGFVYDLSDDANPQYYDLRSHLNIPPEWVDVWGKHINNHGQGVGFVRNATGNSRGIWFEMDSADWGFVPEPVGGEFITQILINNSGDISIGFTKPDDSDDFYVFNPDPIGGYMPIYGGFDAWSLRISDSGHVVGELSAIEPGDGEDLFRWMPGDPTPEVLDNQKFREFGTVNGMGEIVGTYWNSTVQGSGGQSSFEVFRYRSETDFDILPLETGNAKGFNNSGDVAGNLDYGDLRLYSFHSSGPDAFLYQDEWGLIPLDDIVVGTDAQFFRDADINFGGIAGSVLTNRDSTGFGSILGAASISTTTGKGRNRVTTTERRNFVLIPELLEPTPGITVSPASGLVTTESEDSASFTVKLNTEPTANVTINLSSSDTTEGTIDGQATLEFTTTNWATEQTVTVAVVDDSDPDGDVEYTITLDATGGDYEGMTAAVTVTNQDDEVSNITMSVDDPSINEGNNGDQTPGQFTITLSGAASADVQVWYQVSNGTARNKDYDMVDSASGLLTFNPGDTSKTVSFIVLGDTRRESDETFSIELTDPFGATISKSVGTATIIDND